MEGDTGEAGKIEGDGVRVRCFIGGTLWKRACLIVRQQPRGRLSAA